MLSSKRNFFSQNFLGQLHREPPQKSIFWTAQARVLVFYDISRYLPDKHFDIVWGCHPLGTPQKSIFWTVQLRAPVCLDISRYLTEKYFGIVWGCQPPGIPQKSNFWTAQLRVPVCIDISRDLTDKYFGLVLGCHLPWDPPIGPPKINFLNGSTYRASALWYQEIYNWQKFWLYFSGGSIIRSFWIIIADLTVDKSTFERHSISYASVVHWVCWQTPI